MKVLPLTQPEAYMTLEAAEDRAAELKHRPFVTMGRHCHACDAMVYWVSRNALLPALTERAS
jgi:hypothetical protein